MASGSLAGSDTSSAVPLYSKLRPRPNGPAREEVVANQRARLHGATVEAVTLHGYSGTSVAELCRLAGISKRTFYEQFDNKEACFLASYERIITGAATRVVSARSARADRERRLSSALEALLLEAAERPKAARLVLWEAGSAGPAVLQHGARRRAELERMTVAWLLPESTGGWSPGLLGKGIVWGIEHVICKTLTNERSDEAQEIAAGLARWMLQYRSAAIDTLAQVKMRPTEHRRGHGSSDGQRTLGRRARILHAAAEIAASDGYEHLSIAAIASRAAISESELMSFYDSAAACYLDAVDLVGLEALIMVGETARRGGEGLTGAALAVASLMVQISQDRILRRTAFAEVSDHEGQTRGHGDWLLHGVFDTLKGHLPAVERLDWVQREAVAGGLYGVIRHYISVGAPHALAVFNPELVYFALAPFGRTDDVLEVLNRASSVRSQ